MFSLEFTRSFKLFLRRFLSFELCFLVFRCSIFKVRFALRSRGQLIQYITSLSFCQEVFQNFFKFFSFSFLPQALLTACRLFDSLSIISLRRSFVKRFFLTFSSFYFLFLHLLGFRDTALSSVHIFYHFLHSLSTLFCLFLPSFPQLRCFAHFLSLFLPWFCTHSLLRHFQVLYFYFTYICAALYLRYYILLPASICVIFSTPTPDPVGRPDFSRFIQTRCRRVEHGKEEISEKSAFLPNTRYKSARS